MENRKTFLVFNSLFLAFLIILSVFNIIDFSLNLVAAFVFASIGSTLVIMAFGTTNRTIIFIGTVLFFLGVVFLAENYIEFTAASQLFFPVLLFSISTAFGLMFINEPYKKLFVLLFLATAIIGIIVTFYTGNIKVIDIGYSFLTLAKQYWIFLLLVVVILLISLSSNRKK